jgi:hypothetical protein
MTGEAMSLLVTIRHGSPPAQASEDDPEFKLMALSRRVDIRRASLWKDQVDHRPFGEVIQEEGPFLLSVSSEQEGPWFARDPAEILQRMLYRTDDPHVLKPRNAELHLDRTYSLYAMGLLAQSEPRKALQIMKKTLYRLS